MMLLLDTHAFIWFTQNHPSLGLKAKELLMNEENEVFLSIASIWEMSVKVRLGKLAFSQPFRTFIADQLEANKIKILYIDIDQATCVCDLMYAKKIDGSEHKDPFDRMIVIQSKLKNIPLLSNEEIFEQYGIVRVWN